MAVSNRLMEAPAMGEIENVAKSQEGLNQVIHDIRAENTSLRESYDGQERALSDLREALRTQQEAAAAFRAWRPVGADSVLLRYVLDIGADGIDEELREAKLYDTTLEGRQSRLYEVDAARGSYFKSASGCIQLTYREYADGGHTWGLLDDPKPKSEWQAELQRMVTTLNIVRSIKKGRAPGMSRGIERMMRAAPDMIRKIFTDSSTEGAEWIPDNLLPQLLRDVEQARRVEALFDTIDMPVGGDLKLPYLTTGLRPRLAAINTTDDPAQFSASSLATADRTFTAKKLIVRAQLDEDASEDSIISAEGEIRRELAAALVDGSEDCIINGDTTSTHADTGITGWNIRSRWGTANLGGTDDHRRAWIGLREHAVQASNTTDQGSAQTVAGARADLLTLKAPLFANNTSATPGRLFLSSAEYVMKQLMADTSLLTVDKYGPAATILTGEVAKIHNVPVLTSWFIDVEYNASGLYDDSTKTKTGMLTLNTQRFRVARRRAARVRLQSDINRGVVDMVADERKQFKAIDATTVKSVHWAYNLTP